MAKNRKQKSQEYQEKFGGIPVGYKERLEYMYEVYNLSSKPAMRDAILEKRYNMIDNLQYYDLDIVSLYEIPEGTARPRFRMVNRNNFHNEAMANPSFVHVYTIGAADDFQYMRRMVDNELIPLEGRINTPVIIQYNAYFKTPSYFSIIDTFMAEIGINRPDCQKPDWDNIGKKYCDMYNHNIWIDDATVVEGTVKKFYSILPRVEIKLRYLNQIYTKQQYSNIIKRTEYDGGDLNYLGHNGIPALY